MNRLRHRYSLWRCCFISCCFNGRRLLVAWCARAGSRAKQPGWGGRGGGARLQAPLRCHYSSGDSGAGRVFIKVKPVLHRGGQSGALLPASLLWIPRLLSLLLPTSLCTRTIKPFMDVWCVHSQQFSWIIHTTLNQPPFFVLLLDSEPKYILTWFLLWSMVMLAYIWNKSLGAFMLSHIENELLDGCTEMPVNELLSHISSVNWLHSCNTRPYI